MRFSDLGLIDPLLKALQDVGYRSPSPIQQKAIPPVLQRRDLLGCAQTGTGKTAAFALPLLQLMEARPTRELAAQIQECFENYGRYLSQRSVVIFGGVGQQPQLDALRKGTDILVATPGRLLDLCGQGHISLQELEFFVLDEADRMLDMGFIHDIRRVIKLLPARRQTLFFSATMPEEIRKLAAGLLTNPVEVAVDPVSSAVDTVAQSLLFTDKGSKRDLLLWLLQNHEVSSGLVFVRTKHLADRIARFLKKNGVEADSIHGDKSQGARLKALGNFKSGKCRVLVATDIAARGIDVTGISHVFNFDLPDVPETYVHRIGRTGRAGRQGISLSFCTPDDLAALKDIERLIGRAIDRMEGHPYPCSQPIEPEPAPKPQPKQKKADKAKNHLKNLLKKVEESQEKREEKVARKAEQKQHTLPEIDLDSFRDPDRTQLPAPAGKVFSSEIRLPGWVAARSGPGRKPDKKQEPKPAPVAKAEPLPIPEAPAPQAEPQQKTAPTHKRKKRKKKGGQPAAPQTAPPAEPKKSAFFREETEENRAVVGTSSRSRRRREPVWIPMNDQPIVTRPQSYFIEPPAEAPARPEPKKETATQKRRRRRKKAKQKQSGGNHDQGKD